MPEIKSAHENKQEVYDSIWAIADRLRGSVDGWDFKQYVLTTLFYRFLSEKLEKDINEWEMRETGENPDYANMDDEDALEIQENIVDQFGYFIRPSYLFKNLLRSSKSDGDLNVTISSVFDEIENSTKMNESQKVVNAFEGMFDDFIINDSRLGRGVSERNKSLVKVLQGVAEMDLDDLQDSGIDAFGDAYEFLMRMYASGAGKSGGEFFTPQEVSRLLTLLAIEGKDKVNKVYDPACGSASLLLQASKILGDENVLAGYYGQEINPTNHKLARANMILHDVEPERFTISYGDTLLHPATEHYADKPFDVIVSNPPYSVEWAGHETPGIDKDYRFAPAGVLAPKKKADYAFIMHMLSWLSEQGTAAIVVFPGILYRSGAEGKIRKYLVDNNFVDAVIKLPPNLFFGTGIGTDILILKKNKPDTDILFINAEKEFLKKGNKNVLTEENIQQIVDWHRNHADVDYIARKVPLKEIQDNDYSLDVGQYVEPEDTTVYRAMSEIQADIDEVVAKRNRLEKEVNEILQKMEIAG